MLCWGMNWNPIAVSESDYPGLYAIYLDGRIAYIGTSVAVLRRVSTHSLQAAKDCGMWRGASFKSLSVKTRKIACNAKRLALESALIRRIRPRLNLARNPARKVIKVSMSYAPVNLNFRKFVHHLGGQASVARMLNMSAGHVSLLYNGKRRVTLDPARRIEIATGGRFTKETLAFPERPRLPRLRMPDES